MQTAQKLDRKIGTWTIGIASISLAASQFLQTLWISKIHGASELGLFALVIGVFAPVVSFFSAGQRFIGLSRLKGENESTRGDSVLRAIALIFLLVSISVYTSVINGFNSSTIVLVAGIGYYRIIDGWLEINSWSAQVSGHTALFNRLLIGRAFAIPLACALDYRLQFALPTYVIACCLFISIAAIIVANTKCCQLDKRNCATVNIQYLGGRLFLIFPVGVAAAIESLAVTAPRLFLASHSTLYEVAAYTLFTQIIIALGLIASAKLQADTPIYACFRGENFNRKIFSKVLLHSVLILSGLFFSLFLLIVFIPPNLLGILFGTWFEQEKDAFLFLPLLAWLWYLSGYLSNVVAIIFTAKWLPVSAIILMMAITTSWLILAKIISNGFALSLFSLGSAFIVRGSISLFMLIRKMR